MVQKLQWRLKVIFFHKSKFFEKKTVSFAIKQGMAILAAANNPELDSNSLDINIILSFFLNCEVYELSTKKDEKISFLTYFKYIRAVKKRARGMPIAYITGKKEFYGINFLVSKKTLIPRGDSETLIDAVNSTYLNKDANLKILEFGVGSGCLLLTLISLYKNSVGFGFDKMEGAIKIANKNKNQLNLNNRAKIIKYSWNKTKPPKQLKNTKFDILISNPPYINKNDFTIMNTVKIFEPKTALFSDNLTEYKKIKTAILNWKCLKSRAHIFLEIGAYQEKDIANIFTYPYFTKLNEYKDLSGIIRVLEFQYIDIYDEVFIENKLL